MIPGDISTLPHFAQWRVIKVFGDEQLFWTAEDVTCSFAVKNPGSRSWLGPLNFVIISCTFFCIFLFGKPFQSKPGQRNEPVL